MPSYRDLEYTLSPSQRAELAREPALRGRLFVLNFLTAAFLLLPFLFAVLHAMELMPPPEEPPKDAIIPWIIVIAAVGELPVLIIFSQMFLKRLHVADTLVKATAIGQTLMMVVFALTHAIAIYGFVSPTMGTPRAVGWALIAASEVATIAAVLTLRPRVVGQMMACHLAEQQRAERNES